MKEVIPYKPQLKEIAKQLRKNSTLSEVLLWQRLKGRNIQHCDFHRQKPLGNYIVDFFCPELKLAIEIDGCTHDEKMDKDALRQRELEDMGIHFLRFTDREVKSNLNGVVKAIEEWIKRRR